MTNQNSRNFFAGLALFVLAATLSFTGCASSSLDAMPPTSELALIVVADEVASIENMYVGQTRSVNLSDGTVLEVQCERAFIGKVTATKNGQQKFSTEGGWRKLRRISGGVDVYVFEPNGQSYADLELKMKKAEAYLASRK